jgi:hypothetical protein
MGWEIGDLGVARNLGQPKPLCGSVSDGKKETREEAKARQKQTEQEIQAMPRIGASWRLVNCLIPTSCTTGAPFETSLLPHGRALPLGKKKTIKDG